MNFQTADPWCISGVWTTAQLPLSAKSPSLKNCDNWSGGFWARANAISFQPETGFVTGSKRLFATGASANPHDLEKLAQVFQRECHARQRADGMIFVTDVADAMSSSCLPVCAPSVRDQRILLPLLALALEFDRRPDHLG